MKIDIPANTKTVILNIMGDEMIELKKKVEEAKQVFGLKKNWNLSEAMEHQGRYIDRVLRDGVSTNKQKEIVKTLNMMIDLHKADAEREKETDVDISVRAYHELKESKLKTEIQRLQAELVSVHNVHMDMFNDGSIKNHQISCLLKEVDEVKAEKHREIIEIEKISDARWDDLQEEKSNVRMLNGEVAELQEKLKDVNRRAEYFCTDSTELRKDRVKLNDKITMWKGLAWLAFVIVGCLAVALGVVNK